MIKNTAELDAMTAADLQDYHRQIRADGALLITDWGRPAFIDQLMDVEYTYAELVGVDYATACCQLAA